MTYTTTYYHANMVQNILRDQFGYLRNLDGFYGDQKHYDFAQSFPRISALHSFIHFCVVGALAEDIGETDPEDVRPHPVDRWIKKAENKNPAAFWLDRMLVAHGLPIDGGLHGWAKSQGIKTKEISADDISNYYDELLLDGTIESLCEAVAKEVFFLLFLNRELLHTFNAMMARQFSSEDADPPAEVAHLFGKRGVLKRTRIPRWVQRAVFYRDRGHCVFCDSDLSGLLSVDSPQHYDHIVCLAEGGLNDVTNIQLLCGPCNLKKGAKNRGTSANQELWYAYEE